MKQAAVFLFFLLPVFSSGQYLLTEPQSSPSLYYNDVTPYARAEAMGMAYAAVDGDLNAVVYNPAALASIKGLELSGSSSNYNLNGRYFGCAGVRLHKKFAVGLTLNTARMTEPVLMENKYGQNNPYGNAKPTDVIVSGNDSIWYYGPYTPSGSHARLTLAAQPLKDLFVGVNAGLFRWKPYTEQSQAWVFDVGVIKKFRFGSKTIKHNLNVGASLTNFTFSNFSFEHYYGIIFSGKLPSVVRPAFTYHLEVRKNRFSDTLNSVEINVNSQLDMRIGTFGIQALSVGAEIMFFEVLAIRAGDSQLMGRWNLPGTLTYGFGLQLPLYKLSKFPLKLRFDYSCRPQPQYAHTYTYWSGNQDFPNNNPETFSLSVNWLF